MPRSKDTHVNDQFGRLRAEELRQQERLKEWFYLKSQRQPVRTLKPENIDEYVKAWKQKQES